MDNPRNDQVCKICDGGPANEGACLCGFRKWTCVTDAMVEKALHARIPGGSEAWVWIIGQDDGWKPHQAARDVMRAVLEAVLDNPLDSAPRTPGAAAAH